MKWIDSIPPLKPLVENLSNKQIRLLYRGAEPIKGFVVYTVPYNVSPNRDKATLIKVLIAEKTLDVDLDNLPSKANDKIYISAVDRNNNVSEWLQVK
jgi:hypothetical protein